jgi:hypothetical protein
MKGRHDDKMISGKIIILSSLHLVIVPLFYTKQPIMLTTEAIRAALHAVPQITHVEQHASISSTNDRARELAQAGAPEIALISADEQLAGRGRHGRSWFTPPGAALAISLLILWGALRISLEIADILVVSKGDLPAAATTVRDTLVGLSQNDAGRKALATSTYTGMVAPSAETERTLMAWLGI